MAHPATAAGDHGGHTLETLPDEMLERICHHLEFEGLASLEQASVRMQLLVRRAENVWNRLSHRHFGPRSLGSGEGEDDTHNLGEMLGRLSTDGGLQELARRSIRDICTGEESPPPLSALGGRLNYLQLLHTRRMLETQIRIVEADISNLGYDVDAVVVPSNERLEDPGFGALHAVYKQAGAELPAWIESYWHHSGRAFLEPGEVIVSPSFGSLRAKWIFHAVGINWWFFGAHASGRGEEERKIRAQARLTKAVFDKAAERGAISIAIPGLSTGARRFPPYLVSTIIMGAAKEAVLRSGGQLQVHCVSYGPVQMHRSFQSALSRTLSPLLDE